MIRFVDRFRYMNDPSYHKWIYQTRALMRHYRVREWWRP